MDSPLPRSWRCATTARWRSPQPRREPRRSQPSSYALLVENRDPHALIERTKGRGGIRTHEVLRQRICNPLHLSTLAPGRCRGLSPVECNCRSRAASRHREAGSRRGVGSADDPLRAATTMTARHHRLATVSVAMVLALGPAAAARQGPVPAPIHPPPPPPPPSPPP